MHVLHGTWLAQQQRFVLWGEDTSVSPRSRRGKRAQFASHPYQVTTADWRHHLDRYAPYAEPQTYDGVVWLPGVPSWPLPSPRAREAGMAPPEGSAQLLGWRLPQGVTLGPTEALDYLLRLPPEDEPQHGFIRGDDLRFWQRVGLLAMSCLVEGRFLPALEQRGGALFAYWQPHPEEGVLSQLAAAMPPSCRAYVESPDQAPAAITLLEAFLRSAIDAFVREAGLQQRAPAHPWLRALAGDVRRVTGGAAENRRLWEAWQQWHGISLGLTRGNLRVYFRLDEPVENSASWYLAYLLQAADDPGLLIEADTVWSSAAGDGAPL
jgi:hypothetical protein